MGQINRLWHGFSIGNSKRHTLPLRAPHTDSALNTACPADTLRLSGKEQTCVVTNKYEYFK